MDEARLWKSITEIKTKIAYEGGRSAEYRKNHAQQMTKIVDFVEKAPCTVNSNNIKWLRRGLAGLWILTLVLVAFLLTGCASISTFSKWNPEVINEKGDRGGWEPLYKTETTGNAKTDIVIKDGTVAEIHQDSRNEPLIKLEVPLSKLGGK